MSGIRKERPDPEPQRPYQSYTVVSANNPEVDVITACPASPESCGYYTEGKCSAHRQTNSPTCPNK